MSAGPLNILHLVTTLDVGGAENHLRELMARQVRQGHTVLCVCLKVEGPLADAARAAGVEVLPLDLRRYGDPGPLFALRRLVKARRPTVMHLHLQPCELYGLPAVMLGARPPMVTSRHNMLPFFPGPGADLLEKLIAPHTDRFIAISSAVEGAIRRVNPAYSPSRIGVVPYGIALEPYDAPPGTSREDLREAWGASPGVFVFGTVSRLVQTKRVDILISAFECLKAERPDLRAKLVIVGDGDAAPALRAQAAASPAAADITFAGPRADIPDVMRAFDAFAFASVTEGFGLVLLEAMAARLPVIATGIPPMTDIVRDEETGLSTAVADPASNARAMGRLLDDPALAARLSAAGRACAEAHGLDAMAARIEAIYREAMAERRG